MMNRFTGLTGLLLIVGIVVTSCYYNEPLTSPDEALLLEMERGRLIMERTDGLLAVSGEFTDAFSDPKDCEITPRKEAAFEELKLHVPGLRKYPSLREHVNSYKKEYGKFGWAFAVVIISVMTEAQLEELGAQLAEHRVRFKELIK